MLLRSGEYKDPSSAKDYSNHNDVQFNQACQFLDENGELIQGPILDIGCGDGSLTAYISSRFCAPITGLDISEARIKFACEHYESTKIKFIVGDAITLRIPYSLGNFSTIVSFNTLHHIPRTKMTQVFENAKNLLKLDGTVLFLIPGRSPELHDAINETTYSKEWKEYFNDFDLSQVRTYESPEYYKFLARETGFPFYHVSSETMASRKELDANGMKNFLRGWLPHLAHLQNKSIKNKETLCENFLTDIVVSYFKSQKVPISGVVNPKITQNKIVLRLSKQSLFKIEITSKQLSKGFEPLRSRL